MGWSDGDFRVSYCAVAMISLHSVRSPLGGGDAIFNTNANVRTTKKLFFVIASSFTIVVANGKWV